MRPYQENLSCLGVPKFPIAANDKHQRFSEHQNEEQRQDDRDVDAMSKFFSGQRSAAIARRGPAAREP